MRWLEAFESVTVASAQSIDSVDVSFAHVPAVSVHAQPVPGLLLEQPGTSPACESVFLFAMASRSLRGLCSHSVLKRMP